MVSDRTHVPFSSDADEIRQDLLHLILEDEASYPWESSTPASAEFFNTLEQEWVAHQTPEELASMQTHEHSFFAQLEQQWASPTIDTSVHSVQADLVQHFGDRVPSSLLSGIAQQAQALFATQQPMADQLVQCVQNLFSGVSADDLFVLARPYAYSMRGKQSDDLEVALRSVRYAAWTELSGVEQARLSLAIARYTLSKLSTSDA
ncbi:MAG: hypothetical protein VKL39_10355 [Leptolyngbyaceae bacterium]|nr:hypothetical protein [Leptolyngbyaceae bacterium]